MREMIGRNYMTLAVQYGHIELKEGTFLYSAKGLHALGLTDRETGKPALFEAGEFYVVKGKYIYCCYGPENVMDIIEEDNPDQGLELPVTFNVPGHRGKADSATAGSAENKYKGEQT